MPAYYQLKDLLTQITRQAQAIECDYSLNDDPGRACIIQHAHVVSSLAQQAIDMAETLMHDAIDAEQRAAHLAALNYAQTLPGLD